MRIKCPRGRWEIDRKRWAIPNLFHRAAMCGRHCTLIFGNEAKDGNRRHEDQPHNPKGCNSFRSPTWRAEDDHDVGWPVVCKSAG